MDPFTLLGIDVALFLVIGLLGGAHCIGMCGPLVTVYAGRMNADTNSTTGSAASDGGTRTRTRGARGRDSHLTTYEVRQHALFNLGRTASYTLLGALFGALGSALFVTTAELTPVLEAVRGGVGLVVGGFVIVTGIYYLLGKTTGGVHLPGLERIVAWMTTRVDHLANGPGIVGLGALHGLLPCPILYPAFLYAFAVGSPAGGALALAALGVGTIPAVFLYGTLIETIDVAHRQRIHRLLGVAFVVLGYVLFAHGLMSLGIHALPHPELPFYDGLEGASAGMGAESAHEH